MAANVAAVAVTLLTALTLALCFYWLLALPDGRLVGAARRRAVVLEAVLTTLAGVRGARLRTTQLAEWLEDAPAVTTSCDGWSRR